MRVVEVVSELLVEREVEREDLTRLVAALRMELEQAQARGPVQLDATGREAALKGTLKLERERRHAAEVRLRRILGVLRSKLGDVPRVLHSRTRLLTTTPRISRR